MFNNIIEKLNLLIVKKDIVIKDAFFEEFYSDRKFYFSMSFFCFICILGFAYIRQEIYMVFFSLIIPFIIMAFFYSGKMKEVFKEIVANNLPEIKFSMNPDKYEKEISKLKNNKLVPYFGEKTTSNFISYDIDNVNLVSCHLEVVQGSHKHRFTVFSGTVVKFNFHKKVSANIVVLRNKRLFDISWLTSNLNKISLLANDFNKLYSVYSDDNIVVRKILKPQVMTNLESLEKVIGYNVDFAILENEMHIVIPNLKIRSFLPVNFSKKELLSTISVYLENLKKIFYISQEIIKIIN